MKSTIFFALIFLVPNLSRAKSSCEAEVKLSVQCADEKPNFVNPIRISKFEGTYFSAKRTKLSTFFYQCDFQESEFDLQVQYLDREGQVQVARIANESELVDLISNVGGLSESELSDWVSHSVGTPILTYSKSKLANQYRTIWFNWGIGGFGRDRGSTLGYPDTYISAGPQKGGVFRSLHLASDCQGTSSLGKIDRLLNVR
ncbi:MAG: hypothetical protein KDD25_08945 [Bdellovibrionales bacterium]|nr:hypothetical protein [Bdellovibrionales bacterium]